MKHIRFYCTALLAAAAVLLAGGCNDDKEGPAPGGEFTLGLTVGGVTDVSVELTVAPSSDTKTYFAGAVAEATLASHGDDIGRYVASLVDLAQEEDPSLSKAEAIRSLVRTGRQTISVGGLTPETACVAFAVGLDETGEYTSDPVRESFTTTASSIPADQFDISIDEVTSGSVGLTVTPVDNGMTYYFDITMKSDYEAYEGDISRFVEELIAKGVEMGIPKDEAVKVLQVQGVQSDVVNNLPAETDFVAFAIGLDDDGNCTTEATIAEFRTLAAGDPAKCTFVIEHPQISDRSALLRVTPSDQAIRYFYITLPVSAGYTDEELTASMPQVLLGIAADYGRPLTEIIQTMTRTGIVEEMEVDLTPGTEYISYVYAMNETTAEAEGPVFRGEFTTTGASSEADFSVGVANVRWFNGSELAGLDPKYEQIADGTYVLADVVTEGEVETTYVSLSAGDLSNPETHPDDSLIDALMFMTSPNKTEIKAAMRYGDATFVGFAVDAFGRMSEVFRKKITITEEGAAPVEEFPKDLLSQRMGTVSYAAPMYFGARDDRRAGELLDRLRSTSRLERIAAE